MFLYVGTAAWNWTVAQHPDNYYNLAKAKQLISVITNGQFAKIET